MHVYIYIYIYTYIHIYIYIYTYISVCVYLGSGGARGRLQGEPRGGVPVLSPVGPRLLVDLLLKVSKLFLSITLTRTARHRIPAIASGNKGRKKDNLILFCAPSCLAFAPGCSSTSSCSNRLFQVLDSHWQSPETAGMRLKSRRLKKTIRPRSTWSVVKQNCCVDFPSLSTQSDNLILHCAPLCLASAFGCSPTSSCSKRLVIMCQSTSVSAAHATHCAAYYTPCRPLIRALS